jgi:CBS domain-containing protein
MVRTVGEVMTPNPTTIDADAPVAWAARLMRESDIGSVLVADHDRFVGIVTDRDIVVRVLADDRDPRDCPVREAASGDVETVTPDTEIGDAAEVMRTRAVRRLPVVDAGRIVGVVSLGDFAVARDEESVLGKISSMPGNQ